MENLYSAFIEGINNNEKWDCFLLKLKLNYTLHFFYIV